ncbi:cystathionine gamma-synthase [Modestobacter versicolor]|uniref:Cystathionine gamma-synthase n=1 Tax=Modestobacter versicolor TaxID=429133 RepID=A0A323V647_9ACTN|nr:cystathionine gamma-synthase [Modestobacter versicolor]MBB3678614.1 cystathionine gamma-synthase [Modestobacter versicolor]PZA19563.1 cystathionine gamma-synthase [Modestobacter versicolor]
MTGFNTRAIHAGQEPDPATGAVIPPLHLTTTYKQDGVGGLRGGYEYSRSANPTRDTLQTALASLEQGTRAMTFASGLAAEDTLLRTVCRPGDSVVLGGDAYGGTYRLISRVMAPWGVGHQPVDLNDLDAVRAAVAPETTRVVWCETPSNPLLNVADIAALAEIAHAAGTLLVVDNTFASPYLQQPLTLGADVVVHSTTKYLGGHSDVVGGALVVADDELGEQLAFLQNAAGAVNGPFDAWLVLRSLKTLGVRMERHSANGARIAEWLLEHPAVGDVLYPGLPQHRNHEVAASQMSGFGGMVSFRLRGTDRASAEEAALRVCERTELFTLAESLGGVESLVEHPHRMTHASAAGSPLEVPADLVRLSVGIEDVDDLIADLDQALT